MSNKAIIGVDIQDKNLEDKLEVLLTDNSLTFMKEVLNTYYALRVQQSVNDKKYEDLVKIEGIVELFALLNSKG